MSIKRQAVSGAKWIGISGAFTAVLQFAQLAVLARLLAPEDFGLMAMIVVILGLAQAFADVGVSNAIIHRQDATRDQLSSLYWLNLLAGMAVYATIATSSSIITLLYSEPRLAELVPIAALVFLISPLGQQFQVLLEKNLRFKPLATIESGAAVAGVTVAILAALTGQGVYALIYGSLVAAICKAIALAAIGWREWRPSLHFRTRDLTGFLSFGLYQIGERTLNHLTQRFDQLLIGTLLGAQELGYYSLAYGLVAQPISRINPILTRVAFPVFARVQNDHQKLKSGFMTLRNILAAINFPILFGMIGIAPVFVPLILGNQWLPSIILVQILALVALMRSIGNPVGSLLLAMGRPDLGLYINCLLPIFLLPAVYIGARLGDSVGVSLALLLVTLAFFWVGYFFLIRRLLGPCLRPYLATYGPAGLTAGIMALTVAGLPLVLALDGFWLLAVQVTVGVFVYVILNWMFYRERAVAVLRLALGTDT